MPESQPEINGSTSDGYHTFDELYEHRTLLLAAFLEDNDGWISDQHSDGTMFDGMFIAGTELMNGKQITYHQDMKYWPYFLNCRILDRAPAWDGHTSQDVVDRFKEWLSV
jgi:hypothetical protein